MATKTGKRLFWALLFSIVFTVFLLYRVELEHFSVIADRLDAAALAVAVLVYLLANLVRAFRFFKLDHMNQTLSHWWHMNAFYNFMTSTLPGGAGEAATAFFFKRLSNFDLLSALRILLLSRLMDIFALSMLFFVASVGISADTPYRGAAIWLSGGAFIISAVALLRRSEQFFLRIMQRLPGQSRLVRGVCEKLSELIKISEEQHKANAFPVNLFLSVLMITGSILSIHFALQAFGVDFTLVQSFYCYGIYAIFQIVPVQGIAGIGTQAAWWTLAMNVSGYNAPEAIAMGFTIYAVYYLLVAFVGLFSLFFWIIKKNPPSSPFFKGGDRNQPTLLHEDQNEKAGQFCDAV